MVDFLVNRLLSILSSKNNVNFEQICAKFPQITEGLFGNVQYECA